MAKDTHRSTEPHHSVQRFWVFTWVLLLLPLIAGVLTLLTAGKTGLRDVIDLIYDDGYYYLTIAANIADTGRSTLDGITSTNGYQPLWLWCLAGLGKITGTDSWHFFVDACVFIYLIAGATPLLAILWKRHDSRSLVMCLAGALAIVATEQPLTFLRGLEPILMLPLTLAFVFVLERRSKTPNGQFMLSALIAVAFLIRLDALSLLPAAIASIGTSTFLSAARKTQTSRIKETALLALRLSAIAIPVAAIYLAFNFVIFGTAVPVSGLAKSIGGPLFSNWSVAKPYITDSFKLPILIAALSLMEFQAARMRLADSQVFYRSIATFLIAAALQSFYYAAFSTWPIWPWYTYLLSLATALIFARVVYLAASILAMKNASSSIPIISLVAVYAFAIWGSFTLLLDQIQPRLRPQVDNIFRISAAPPQTTPQTSFNQISVDMLGEFFSNMNHARVVMGDRSGGLAYWGRGILTIGQTEGLTMDIKYIHARKLNLGTKYLENYNPDYMIADREVFPSIQDDAHGTVFIVPDPVQGQVTIDPVPTFCFPEDAIRYRKQYGHNTRLAFIFSQRIPCSASATALIRSIETGEGLRRFSFPTELRHSWTHRNAPSPRTYPKP